jgi:hypothetical protein
MFDLKRVPYDIRPYIFEDLDRKTLLNVCLASRSLNELASWPLYSHIVINGPESAQFANMKQPYAALRRRPVLRNAVTEVTLYRTLRWRQWRPPYSSLLLNVLAEGVHQWQKDNGPSLWARCGEELKKMPRLRTLRIDPVIMRYGYQQHEPDLLFYMISTIPTIRHLHTPDIPYKYTDKVKYVHHFVIKGYPSVLEEARSSSLNSHVRSLHIRSLVRTRLNPISLLNSDRYGRSL